MTEEKKTDINDAIENLDESKVLAAIGYISILCFVPLILARDSKFAQFHAKQGLVLFIAELIAMFVSAIVGWIPIIGWLTVLAMYALLLAFAIIGLLKALAGEKWEMPVLGKYAKNLKV